MASSNDHESAHVQLAQAGYDVFVANNRGTDYSLKHASLKAVGATADRYWDYTWTDLARDVEANV